MRFNLEIDIADFVSCTISFLALCAAIYIGLQQNRINRRMLTIQDNMDVFLQLVNTITESDAGEIRSYCFHIYNVSATPLCLSRYTFNGIERVISPYRLPPASQFPNAYYYINLPSPDVLDYSSFDLHFLDISKRKWLVSGRTEWKNGRWEISWDLPQIEK